VLQLVGDQQRLIGAFEQYISDLSGRHFFANPLRFEITRGAVNRFGEMAFSGTGGVVVLAIPTRAAR
jgi:hypothetical protein